MSEYVFLIKLQASYLRHGAVIVTTALHSIKSELMFSAGPIPARSVLEISDGEDLWQWSCLEIRLNAFRSFTIPLKRFRIIIASPCNFFKNETPKQVFSCELCEIFKDIFIKNLSGGCFLIFAKSFIIDVWKGPKYASDYTCISQRNFF